MVITENEPSFTATEFVFFTGVNVYASCFDTVVWATGKHLLIEACTSYRQRMSFWGAQSGFCEKFHQVDRKTILITLIQPKITYCLSTFRLCINVEPRVGQAFTY